MEALKTELANFKTDFIDFDILNPRGENEETIINDEGFNSLVDSIRQYGILEPIIIKENPENINRYLLVDGERRLRAAKSLRTPLVPALLIHKNLDGKILAYHVHMLRKQWGKAAETKSIKRIINEIEKNNPNLSELEIKKKIKEITKTNQSRINDLYILTKYEDKYIDLVASEKLDLSYLIQGQTSFINRLLSKYPEILEEFSENRLRSIIADKSYKKLVPGTRFWMDTFKEIFNHENDRDKIKKLLIEFLENKEISAGDVYKKFKIIIENKSTQNNDTPVVDNKKTTTSDNLNNATKNTPNQSQSTTKPKDTSGNKENLSVISEVKKNEGHNSSPKFLDYSPITLSKKQQISIKDIRPKFDRIGKNLTLEEKEYIAEAIHCLEMQCFKASVLMIWATGISRILNIISRDINEFNSCSKVMKSKNTSFYKHHSSTFQDSATSLDDIRHASKDIQLLCYLTYKKIIDESQFKKLKANYDVRNDCAHPTSIKLEINETVAIFENVLNLIINNQLLK